MKFSYSNPGCQGFLFGSDEALQLKSEIEDFVAWASFLHQTDTYDLEWNDNNRYGTPYVGGRLILETNGFGLGYEGSPQLSDCAR
jgi:hypothetical protein